MFRHNHIYLINMRHLVDYEEAIKKINMSTGLSKTIIFERVVRLDFAE